MTDTEKIASNLVWRLEILQVRSRFVDGEAVRLPTRVRRFSNALPAGSVCGVLEALVGMAPYSGAPLFNGEAPGSSETYVPSSTYIRKDDTLKTGTRDATYTIVQDLRMSGDSDAEGFGDSSSCSSVSESSYLWDEGTVPDVGTAGQGVTKQIVDVNRDRETDLFSYRIRTVTALTQHLGEHTSECTEEYVRTVETWDNVYGTEDDFLFDHVSHPDPATGVRLDPYPPDPCSASQGTVVAVEVAENDDCTFKIRIVRTTSKVENPKEYTRYRDLYVKRDVDSASGAQSPLPSAGQEVSRGVKTTYESKLNPDGTYENRTVTETERAVSKAAVEYRKTLRGLVSVVTDRNQSSGVSSSGLAVGEVRTSKRTDGGRYDNTVQKVQQASVGLIGSSCETSVFQHQHTETSNVRSRPGQEAAAAGSGKTYRVVARETEEGTWDVDDTVVSEIARTDAQVSVHKTLRGTVTTRVDRNVSNGSVLVSKVGDRVQVEVTPGGRYNRTVTSVTSSGAGGVIGSSCETSVFQHQHTETSNVGSKPEQEAAAAGSGKTYRVVARETEEGTWDVDRVTVSEIAVPGALVKSRRTVRGVVTERTDRNSSDASVSLTKVGDEVQLEVTPGGLFNRTVRSLAAASVSTLSEGCSTSRYRSSVTTVDSTAGDKPSVVPATPSVNRESSETVRLSEEGMWDREITSTSFTGEVRGNMRSGGYDYVETVTVGKNETSFTGEEGGIGKVVSITAGLNEHGSVDYTKRVRVPRVAGDTWEVEVDLEMHYSRTRFFVNCTSEQYQKLVLKTANEVKDKVVKWRSQDRCPQSYRVTPSVSRNEFGLYNGSVTTEISWAPNSAGMTGAVNETFFSYNYRDVGRGLYTKMAHGRGRRQLQLFLMGCGNTAQSVDFSYDPTTSIWGARYTERDE